MNLRSRLRLLTFLGMGAVGAVAGHVVGYWAAHPHAHERAAVLQASGHGYLEIAIAVALVAGLVALMGELALGCLARRSVSGDRPWMRTWVALALVQAGAFIAVEVAERALNGITAFAVFDEPAFWLGLPLQVAIAAAGALLLTLARKVGVLVGKAVRVPATARVPLREFSPTTSAPVISWTGFAVSLRGPPPSL